MLNTFKSEVVLSPHILNRENNSKIVQMSCQLPLPSGLLMNSARKVDEFDPDFIRLAWKYALDDKKLLFCFNKLLLTRYVAYCYDGNSLSLSNHSVFWNRLIGRSSNSLVLIPRSYSSLFCSWWWNRMYSVYLPRCFAESMWVISW